MSKTYTIVTFGPEVDYVMALYLDGSLVTYGDEYHDRISSWIGGYRKAVELYCPDFIWVVLDVPQSKCRGVLEMGDGAPDKWPDRKYAKHARDRGATKKEPA